MSDELAAFTEYLDGLKETVDNVLSDNIKDKAQSSLDTIVRASLREILLELGMAAIGSIIEYNNPKLQALFEKMLSKPSHVSVKDGHIVTAFNEKVAGDPIDLFSVPKQHTMTLTAPFIWKYGIYKPGREDFTPETKSLKRMMEKLPSYDTVIDERVSYWEGLDDRAPYWILIDKGTAAFGDEARAYPQFKGTNFVDQFRSIAARAMERAKVFYLQNVVESLGVDLEIIFREPKPRGRVTIARIPVGDNALSILYSSAGNVFFQIGRRGLSFQEAKNILKRSYR